MWPHSGKAYVTSPEGMLSYVHSWPPLKSTGFCVHLRFEHSTHYSIHPTSLMLWAGFSSMTIPVNRSWFVHFPCILPFSNLKPNPTPIGMAQRGSIRADSTSPLTQFLNQICSLKISFNTSLYHLTVIFLNTNRDSSSEYPLKYIHTYPPERLGQDYQIHVLYIFFGLSILISLACCSRQRSSIASEGIMDLISKMDLSNTALVWECQWLSNSHLKDEDIYG